MEDSTRKRVRKSMMRKKYLAKLIGVDRNHFYQCMAGTRNLSGHREKLLRNILAREGA